MIGLAVKTFFAKYLYAIIVVAFVACMGFSYMKGRTHGGDSVQIEWDKEKIQHVKDVENMRLLIEKVREDHKQEQEQKRLKDIEEAKKFAGLKEVLEQDIKERLRHIDNEQKKTNEKLDALLHAQSSVKGGWKVLTIFFSALLVFSGFIAWALEKIQM